MKQALDISLGVAGYYKLETGTVDEHGVETKRVVADWFPNLITNNGMDLVAADTFDYLAAVRTCCVGSGSSAPSFTQSSMDNLVAVSQTYGQGTGNGNQTSVSPKYGWRRLNYVFGKGDAAGNLSEIGVGPSATGNGLFSRSLIKDDAGNPTTITVLDNEILYVSYELRCYIPEADVAGSVVISGVTYNTTTRALNTGSQPWSYTIPLLKDSFSYNGRGAAGYGDLGDPTASYPAATYYQGEGPAPANYVNGSYRQDITYSFNPDEANDPNGINVVWWYTGIGAFQVKFDKPIPKDNTKTFTFTVRMSWARYGS